MIEVQEHRYDRTYRYRRGLRIRCSRRGWLGQIYVEGDDPGCFVIYRPSQGKDEFQVEPHVADAFEAGESWPAFLDYLIERHPDRLAWLAELIAEGVTYEA